MSNQTPPPTRKIPPDIPENGGFWWVGEPLTNEQMDRAIQAQAQARDEHIKRLVRIKLFEAINLPYPGDAFFKDPHWRDAHQWNKQQERLFMDWLTDFLTHSKSARDTFGIISKRPQVIEAAVQHLTLKGWRYDMDTLHEIITGKASGQQGK